MRVLSAGAICMLAFSTHANVIQYFAGISYNNPSELFKVKNSEVLIGGTGSYADLRFRGSQLNFNTQQYDFGYSYSRTYTLMPYGRIAKRLNKKTVIGLDLTEPFNSNLDWGSDTFTRYANTQNYLRDVDLSPKIAYSLTQNLQLGGGLNFNFLTNNEVNFALPITQTTYGNMVNKSSSYGFGYNFGATYMFNQTNFLGFTFYSKIRQSTKGTSVLGPYYSDNLLLSFTMPTTTSISFVHIFNPKWLVNLQAFQSGWNANRYVQIFNTASPPPRSNFRFSMKFDQSYVILGALRNQFAEKLGLTLLAVRDDGPEQSELRTITFPAAPHYFVGLVGDYHFTEHTSVELLYGHLFSNTMIGNKVNLGGPRPVPFTTGIVNINVNVLDLKLKVEM